MDSSKPEFIMKYPYRIEPELPGTSLIPVTGSSSKWIQTQHNDDRIVDIVAVLSRANTLWPIPLQVREYGLPPAFVKGLGRRRRNPGRAQDTSRFLVIDLDSFESFLMD